PLPSGGRMNDALHDLPNVDSACWREVDGERLHNPVRLTHRPRILLLYGSARQRSYSRLATLEAARLLEAFGAEPRVLHPMGLPLPDDADEDHPKVRELREAVAWCEGMVWCSPER